MGHGNNRLLVATNNKGKLTELNGLLAGLPLELLSLSDIGCTVESGATGSTFFCASAGVASITRNRARENDTDENMVAKNPVAAILTR